MPVTGLCDALLVLGGEDRQHWPRCRTALRLYVAQQEQGHPPPKVVVSGGVVVSDAGQMGTEAELMATFLQARGMSPSDILVEPWARNTFENVLLGGCLAVQHGCQRIGLITDDYHHWRSLRLYQRVFGHPPAAVWGTGDHGTWRQRLREWLSYARMELAWHIAQTAQHQPNTYRVFLQKKSSP